MNFINAIITKLFPSDVKQVDDKYKILDSSMNEATDVITAVDTYVNTPSTKYAIMIDGMWGCGKTHLWINTISPEIIDKESIYVSLFGLKSIKDIDNEIFKKMSPLGNDNDGILKGLLNSNPELMEGVRVGGIGFAVQYGFNKWREVSINKSKNMLICFDDLERWSGDIDICLSYINKLVEHEGVKCLVIGNTNDLSKDNQTVFNIYREKTIKYIYKLEYPSKLSMSHAIKLANYPCSDSKSFVQNLLEDNISRISVLLDEAHYSNIRTISTAISFMAIIYRNKKDVMLKSPTKSISYFESLLSLLIVSDNISGNEESRRYLLDSTIDNVTKYRKIHSNGDGENEINLIFKDINDNVLQKALLTDSQTGYKGRLSIIKYGFFKQDDFDQELLDWQETEDYELYLDTFKFWYFDDEKSKSIFSSTYEFVFTDKKITNPATLLSVADRMTCDIKRGAVGLDFEATLKQFEELFEELYESNKMDVVRDINPHWGREKFMYCPDLYYYVKAKNDEYIEKHEILDLSLFWSKLRESAVDFNSFMSKLDTLDRRYKLIEVYSQYSNPHEIIDILASFTNDQLFEFTRWMGSRIETEAKSIEDESAEYSKAKTVATAIEDQYKDKFTVKSGHMKQIARIINNKRTDYDPEFIDELRKKATN